MMLVITLTNCPDAVRGDLSKWLLEVNVGVFVGRVSARVRDRLWSRVVDHVRDGRATMVFGAATEQGLDFRIANSEWIPVDFDGLKLILRPDFGHGTASGELSRPGFSRASRMLRARRMAGAPGARVKHWMPERLTSYRVIDVKTTGLSPDRDDIIEMSAIRVIDGKETDRYNALVRRGDGAPARTTELTGITEEMLRDEGRELGEVLDEYLSFIGEGTLLAHNAGFDLAFLNAACVRLGKPAIGNRSVDTLVLSKKLVSDVRTYSLESLAEHFRLEPLPDPPRGLADCIMTRRLYEKLMDLERC